jgi:hypothetical protein
MPSPLLDFFEGIYVINLPERRDRLADMQQELKRIGVCLPSNHVTIFPAIKPTEPDQFPSIGARGCFLSHLQVLTQACERGLSNVLILEDDLSFTHLFRQHQSTIIQTLSRSPWDIAYLGHRGSNRSAQAPALKPHRYPGAVLDLLLIFLKGSRSEPFKKINNRFETLPVTLWRQLIFLLLMAPCCKNWLFS